jgi:hypothetical protein
MCEIFCVRGPCATGEQTFGVALYELLTVLRLCLEELRNIRQLLARLVEAVQPLFQLLHRDAWYMFAYFVADWVVGLIASVAGVIQAKK